MDMIFFWIFETGYICVDEACLEPTDILPPQASGLGLQVYSSIPLNEFQISHPNWFSEKESAPICPNLSVLWLEQEDPVYSLTIFCVHFS